ncbi:MAG: BON domain-containing protein [Alphaproteobacteria bacterium]
MTGLEFPRNMAGAGRRAVPRLAALLALAVAGQGCAPVLIAGAGATAGVVVAEEREVGEVVDDTGIKLRINQLWLQEDADLLIALSTRVTQGGVLVTGTVADPDQRVTAIRLVWQVEGVREVINEIEVANSEGVAGYARDVAISTQLRSRLLFDTSIQSINYSVLTESGTVYLMGIAQDQDELNRVIGHARDISYVRRVVDYVRVKDATG